MRLVQTHEIAQPLRLSQERLDEFMAWLYQEHEDAFSARQPAEAAWNDCLRMYESIPKVPRRDTPVENAPNIEVPLGAIAADSLYAQTTDLIFNISPVLTVRPNDTRHVKLGKVAQRWINHLSETELGARAAADHVFLDDIQLGTGVFYIPYTERRRKTKVYSVDWRGPHLYPLPVEDFLVPGGASDDLEAVRWATARFWHTKDELDELSRLYKWGTALATPAASVDWVRLQREQLGRTSSQTRIGETYETMHTFAYYDIDGDGIREDLLATWDRTSRTLYRVRYNPFDHRPFAAARYQLRAHLFYGLGVIEMLRPFQESSSDLFNAATLNQLLANARMWAARSGVISETFKVWPGKVVVGLSDPKSDLVGIQMADVYPSNGAAVAALLSLAERRVGVTDITQSRQANVLGSRTPGITALSMLNQAARRFAPAFDGMRLAYAQAHRQAIYRVQEKLLAGGDDANDLALQLKTLLGPSDGTLLIDALKSTTFDDAMTLELTASSATINREVERQNMILVANLMVQYYERIVNLSIVAANPQMPEPVREVAKRVSDAAGELADRILRTFDAVRDPEAVIVSLSEVFNELDRRLESGAGGLGQLLQRAFSSGFGGAAGNGAGPAALLPGIAGGPGEEAGTGPPA